MFSETFAQEVRDSRAAKAKEKADATRAREDAVCKRTLARETAIKTHTETFTSYCRTRVEAACRNGLDINKVNDNGNGSFDLLDRLRPLHMTIVNQIMDDYERTNHVILPTYLDSEFGLEFNKSDIVIEIMNRLFNDEFGDLDHALLYLAAEWFEKEGFTGVFIKNNTINFKLNI